MWWLQGMSIPQWHICPAQPIFLVIYLLSQLEQNTLMILDKGNHSLLRASRMLFRWNSQSSLLLLSDATFVSCALSLLTPFCALFSPSSCNSPLSLCSANNQVFFMCLAKGHVNLFPTHILSLPFLLLIHSLYFQCQDSMKCVHVKKSFSLHGQ